MSAQTPLFADAPPLPAGFVYRKDFVSEAEEAGLLAQFALLPLEPARYRGYVAKRRTLSFGYGYDFAANRLHDAPALPAFLEPLRARAAAWAGIPPERFVQELVTEYRPGTPIGWHRDVPQFELVVGISLGSACRMRFRPYPPPSDWPRRSFALVLEPRSAYLLRDEIRWRWQHSIPEVTEPRWSVTFRTLSGRASR
jgi:alkylated DNA repair dioxygenase AlkB